MQTLTGLEEIYPGNFIYCLGNLLASSPSRVSSIRFVSCISKITLDLGVKLPTFHQEINRFLYLMNNGLMRSFIQIVISELPVGPIQGTSPLVKFNGFGGCAVNCASCGRAVRLKTRQAFPGAHPRRLVRYEHHDKCLVGNGKEYKKKHS